MAKRVVKLSIAYLESIIGSLESLLRWSDDQVQMSVDKTRDEALADVIKGLQTTITHAVEDQGRGK